MITKIDILALDHFINSHYNWTEVGPITIGDNSKYYKGDNGKAYLFILFSQNINKGNFDDICDELIKYPYIQETTEEGYRECLGPEIGSTIKGLINSVRLNG